MRGGLGSIVGPVHERSCRRHHPTEIAITDGQIRWHLLKPGVSPDEPGTCDIVTFRAGHGAPRTVSDLQTLKRLRPRSRPPFASPLVGKFAVPHTGHDSDQRRPQMLDQLAGKLCMGQPDSLGVVQDSVIDGRYRYHILSPRKLLLVSREYYWYSTIMRLFNPAVATWICRGIASLQPYVLSDRLTHGGHR